jgi:hypothetical protein
VSLPPIQAAASTASTAAVTNRRDAGRCTVGG